MTDKNGKIKQKDGKSAIFKNSNTQQKFQGECGYCGRWGHKRAD